MGARVLHQGDGPRVHVHRLCRAALATCWGRLTLGGPPNAARPIQQICATTNGLADRRAAPSWCRAEWWGVRARRDADRITATKRMPLQGQGPGHGSVVSVRVTALGCGG